MCAGSCSADFPPDCFLDNKGGDCNAYEGKMWTLNGNACSNARNKQVKGKPVSELCCSGRNINTNLCLPKPTGSGNGGNNYQQGNEPECKVCFKGNFPGKPYTITTVAYVPGNPSCEDLYWMGKTGNIPAAICYPLQIYMQGPCGCNIKQPTAPPPVPAPVPRPAPGPPTMPARKQKPRGDKNDMKLGYGRARGTTNRALAENDGGDNASAATPAQQEEPVLA